MSKIQDIAKRLSQINDAVFQELCDCFLALRHPAYKMFSRTGSQDFSQKTVKGTPDSLFLLPNNNYIFVEVTTQQTDVYKKFKKDIEKCSDEGKTGIPLRRVQEIILCFNTNLKSLDIESLNKSARELGIYKLSFFNLDRLATEISLHHRDLARDYLDLPLDSGQIVSLERFIQSYNLSGQRMATPLDNQFFHRKNELTDFSKLLKQEDLIIFTGAPGVGKTRLAIEGILNFLKENLKFNAYAISNKDADLLEDLQQYFGSGTDNILFVDDVNRIDKFSQILGFYKYKGAINLKIVLTVRDYAFLNLSDILAEYKYAKIKVENFTDDEIIKIIENKPFNVRNPRYQKEIVRIADHNPRLAIMTAMLALKEKDLKGLKDVSDLFDQYFSSFLSDEEAFRKPYVLKTLGVLSFFFTVPYNDDEILSRIEDVFDFSKLDFINALDELERLEVVEIQFEHARVAEQNLAVYYFYKVFLKDQLLSFEKLLFHFFHSHGNRFRDTIIPVNNIFGYERVIRQIEMSLRSYLLKVQDKENRALNFLEHFWFYLQEETLAFVMDIVNKIEETENSKYSTDYNANEFNRNTNKYIELLGEFFRYSNYLREALEIAFEYTRKLPQHLPELIKKIHEILSFDYEDEDYGFKRQKILVSLLRERIYTEDQLYIQSFLAIVKELLKTSFQKVKGGRENTISLYRYSLTIDENIESIRWDIWNQLDSLFTLYEEQCLDILLEHTQMTPDFSKEIFVFDLKHIIPIINKHLSNDNFRHCFYIQKLVKWSERNKIDCPDLYELKEHFESQQYFWYEILDWNSRKGKQDYEFDDWEEFGRLKTADIEREFTFESIDQFYEVDKLLREIKNWKETYSHTLDESLDIIINHNINNNTDLGFEILSFILTQKEVQNIWLYKTIESIAKSKDLNEKFWRLTETIEIPERWQIELLCSIPEEQLEQIHLGRLYKCLKNLKENFTIGIKAFEKYAKLDKQLFKNLLEIIVEKNEEEHFQLRLQSHFFERNIQVVEDIALLKKAYFQQDQLSDHFDHDGRDFIAILNEDEQFIEDYINFIFNETGRARWRDHKNLSIIWESVKAEKLLIKAIDDIVKIKNKDPYRVDNSFMNAFFYRLKGSQVERANKFVLQFISDYSHEPQKINIIFEVVKESRKNLFEKAFKTYLKNNTKIEHFKEIDWSDSQVTFPGNAIIGDIRAAKWSRLLNYVVDLQLGIKAVPIRKHLKAIIARHKRDGDWERRIKFLKGR